MGFKSSSLLVLALFATSYAEELAGWYPVNGRTEDRVKRDASELVDLHNGEFCVDVSEWGDVEYTPLEREQCDSTFEKKCEMKTEQVCGEVTEIECEIVPFTKCLMEMGPTKYKSWKPVEKQFEKKSCTEGVSTVQHEKMMPNCKNVTKLNCVTLWKTDEEGKQVWAGNEDCEPVTWRECKLESVKVGFKVPKMECGVEKSLPWQDIEEAEKETMTTSMTCEVDYATDCKPKTSQKCNEIEYMECTEEEKQECPKTTVQMPTQEFEHKKKCLLPDDGTLPRKTAENEVEGSADIDTSESRRESASQAAPQAGYGAAKPDTGYGSPREGRLTKSLEQQALEQRRVQAQQQALRFRQQQQQQQIQLQQQRQARTFRGNVGQPRFQNRNGKAAQTSIQAHSRRAQNVKFQQGK